MNIGEWKSDRWYIAMTLLSGAAFAAAVAAPADLELKRALVFLTLGMNLFCAGEWRQHPRREQIYVGYKITGYPRTIGPLGVLLNISGLVLAGRGIWLLW